MAFFPTFLNTLGLIKLGYRKEGEEKEASCENVNQRKFLNYCFDSI
jgi:hypothetical protein